MSRNWWEKILIRSGGLIFISLMFASPCLATEYYVAVDGNDQNPGTENQPWQTIQKAAITPIILSVSSEVIATTSVNLLGQNMHLAQLPPYPTQLTNLRYRQLFETIKPGIVRFPHTRFYWDRRRERNAWFPHADYANDGFLAVIDGRLYLERASEQPFPDLSVKQSLDPSFFEEGKEYLFSGTFGTEGVVSAPNGSGAQAIHILPFYEDQSAGPLLVEKSINFGDNPGEQFEERFTYSSGSDKKVGSVWVFLRFIQSSGKIWFDDFKLSPVDNPNVNLIEDGSFDVTWFPPEGYEFRFTALNFEEFMDFFQEVGTEPLLLLPFDTYDPSTPDASEKLNQQIEMNLDLLRFANVENNYHIKYWEIGNEPEIWWLWAGGEHHAGMSEEAVRNRYQKYAEIYSQFAPRAKQIDPSIKLGVDLLSTEWYQASVEGFADGLAPDAPKPDFFAPHPYQLKGWEGTRPVTVENLFHYGSPASYCPTGSFEVTTNDFDPENSSAISWFEAYFECLTKLLKSKGFSDFVYIPTEWESSGVDASLYGTFADEIWSTDRLGRSAKLGIYAANIWAGVPSGIINSYSKINSPYTTFAIYSKFLSESTQVLDSESSADDKISIYAFKNESANKLSVVVVNRIIEDGITGVEINLSPPFNQSVAKQITLTCEGQGCLEQKGATRINGQLVTSDNALTLLSTVKPELIMFSSPYTLEIPNHAVVFWEISSHGVTPTVTANPTPLTPTPTPDPQFKQRLVNWSSDNASYDANGDGVVNSLDFASVINFQ